MNYKAAVISSAWIATGAVSSVFVWFFADQIGNGLPLLLLVLAAIALTVVVSKFDAE